MQINRKRKNVSFNSGKSSDVKRINRNTREQERVIAFNSKLKEISDFLVKNGVCFQAELNSKQKIIDKTFDYIKEMNTITNNDILDLTNIFDKNYDYNQLNKITFCYSQEEAVGIIKEITKIWDEQTGFSTSPCFYLYIDGDSMHDDISNLLMIDYKDIFDLLDHVIDWDRYLTYQQVSFVRANADNFKRLIQNDNVKGIIWETTGPIYEAFHYKN